MDAVRVTYAQGGKRHVAVDDISLALPRGATLCLVGESGSGKTSLALAIPRLLPVTAVTEGQIVFRDWNMLKIKRDDLYEIRRRHISVIFQDAIGSLVPGTRIGTQLRRAISHRLGIADNRELLGKSRALLGAVGLADSSRVLAAYPRELSSGMCQRVMIALALSAEPSLLIADEPLSSLDAVMQVRVLDLLFGLQKSYGYAMLFVTHDLRVAARFDLVGVLHQGRLVELGSAEQVLTRPTATYTRELLAAFQNLPKRESGTADYGLSPGPQM